MSAPNNRIAIFIDGGNLYQRLRESDFPQDKRFDYPAFIERLRRGRAVASKAYYVGIVRNFDHSAKSQRMVEAQQKFLANLEMDGFAIKRGRIVYDHKIREKGVDVQIAIDLIIGAIEDRYDTALIVSSDTDLIPATRYVRSRGKSIEYVGFSAKPSLGMTRESALTILLLPDDVVKLARPEKEKKAT